MYVWDLNEFFIEQKFSSSLRGEIIGFWAVSAPDGVSLQMVVAAETFLPVWPFGTVIAYYSPGLPAILWNIQPNMLTILSHRQDFSHRKKKEEELLLSWQGRREKQRLKKRKEGCSVTGKTNMDSTQYWLLMACWFQEIPSVIFFNWFLLDNF